MAPSWFDEFLTLLADYMQEDIELLPTSNASVLAIMPILALDRDDKVAEIIKNALSPQQSDDVKE